MKTDTKLNFNVNVVKKNTQTLDIELKSFDKNNHEFEIVFPGITLDETYEVKVLSVFSKSKGQTLDIATIRDGKAYFSFDTSLIHDKDTVVSYIYLTQGEIQADVMAFEFYVDLSKIDKNAEITATTYDKNYDEVLEDFQIQLGNYLLSLEEGDGTGALDLSSYATKVYVQEMIDSIEIPEYTEPDLSNYATLNYVTNQINAIDIPEYEQPDLSNFATRTYVNQLIEDLELGFGDGEAPDLRGYATTHYVDAAISNIEFPVVDLSGYATVDYVDNALQEFEVPDIDLSNYLLRSEHTDTVYDDTELREMIEAKPNMVFTDRAEYDSITNPDPNTVYIITKEAN